MIIFFYFLIFLFGLIFGSFLNSVIYRLEKGESFLKGRSFCPHCGHILNWSDLIPIFSFLFLKGRCRYCQKKISIQYPLVELFTAFLFILPFFIKLYSFVDLIFYWLISGFLIIIFVFDLKHYLIPDKIVYLALLTTFFFRLFQVWKFNNWKFLLNPFLSGFFVASFFFLIVFISKEKWMGGGDVKLAFLMGLFLGFPKILVALFSAFFFGAIISIGLILSGKKTIKEEIPFAPFLILGVFLALFWGEELINLYWQFLL
jgi:prepilin signal peptidase PulO-like enzyme (type II secretory pathway)